MTDKDKQFPFRKPDGEIVWVSFARMMEAELGQLQIDGETAVRARDLESTHPSCSERVALRPHCVSDALGFTEKALPEMQRHLKRTKIRGVEFRRDPDVPGFMQVVCDSQKTKLKYAATRGFHDQNSSNGGSAAIGPREINQARELVSRNHSVVPTGETDVN